MMGRCLSFFLILIFSVHSGYAQRSMIDTSLSFPAFKLGYGVQFPGQDLKKRFGQSSLLEGQFSYQFKSGLMIDGYGSFIFGNKVKENDIFSNITTASGNVIDNGGELGNVFLDERGYSLFLTVGYLFPILSPNENSGFVVSAGGGFLQHKIRIEFRDSQIPQLEKSYRKGYDRLSNGPALRGFLGYQFLGKYRLINFYAGFDYVQGWTKNRRGYNFDTRSRDNTQRTDVLTGFRFGWILPLYRNEPDEFYIY